jgi:hypothetical protein
MEQILLEVKGNLDIWVIDGFMTIYFKEVERFYKPVSLNWYYPPEQQDFWWNDPAKLLSYLIESFAFSCAAKLWKSFQTGIYNFEKNIAGNAEIITPEIHRAEIENLILLLKGSHKINKIPCK